MAGTQNHSEFLVLKDGNARFYLEAIAVGNSTKEESEINRINQIYDTLKALESPDFYVRGRCSCVLACRSETSERSEEMVGDTQLEEISASCGATMVGM